MPPKDQWIDYNGNPLNGGTIATYIPDTFTPKTTWVDRNKVTTNSNPIILDVSGRASIYGDGDYRFIVSDSLNNLIYDANTSEFLESDFISTAMRPVTQAITLQEARDLLGVTSAIQNAVNSISLLSGPTGPIGVQGPTGPIGPSGSSNSYSPTLITSNPGSLQIPSVNNGLGNCFLKWGSGTTPSSGRSTVSFDTPFPNTCFVVVASANDVATGSWTANPSGWNSSSFNITTASWVAAHLPGGPQGFTWWAVGN